LEERVQIKYKQINPKEPLSDYIKSFWKFENPSEKDYFSTILPDGCCDILFILNKNQLQRISLTGIWTKPVDVINPPDISIIGIRFKPLGIEYIVQQNVSEILNKKRILSNDFWNSDQLNLFDFNGFVDKQTIKMNALLGSGKGVDPRKIDLFNLIFQSNGAIAVEELSDKVNWSRRQINRYFNEKFGISLKAYCNIIKVYESFKDIKKGKLYTYLNYYDQSHFIKEIKKHTGANPKDLKNNQNDRFLQLFTMNEK
jgi:AraC-like DNA-binding protein